jgi:hypothetical protein
MILISNLGAVRRDLSNAMSFLRILLFLLISFLYAVSPVIAQTTVEQDKAKQIWQLLDYLAVDYGGAVKDGKVVSARNMLRCRNLPYQQSAS